MEKAKRGTERSVMQATDKARGSGHIENKRGVEGTPL